VTATSAARNSPPPNSRPMIGCPRTAITTAVGTVTKLTRPTVLRRVLEACSGSVRSSLESSGSSTVVICTTTAPKTSSVTR
jgi:hypothetical protein